MPDDAKRGASRLEQSDGPAERSSARWRDAGRLTLEGLKRDRASVSAGSLAYHGFLAFFPAVIAALGLLTLLHVGTGSLHHLTHGIGRALPAGASGVFTAAVKAAARRSSGSVVAIVLGIVVALWSSSNAMAVLQQTLDVAYGVAADRKFLARRLRGAGLMVLTGVLGGCASALVVFGEPIGHAISGNVPVGGAAFTVGWTALRWVVALALVVALFSAYYALAPNRPPRRRWISPGSLLASAVFLLASLGFSFYVSTFGSYGKTYGSFAGVAMFIFWLFLAGFAVLLGGELNAALERARSVEGASVPSSATHLGQPSTARDR